MTPGITAYTRARREAGGHHRASDAGSGALPRALRPGDAVAVVAPASPMAERDAVRRSIAFLEGLGLRVVLGPATPGRHGYLAGTDHDRASDLAWALTDESIDGVVCLKGGYGSMRAVLALEELLPDPPRGTPPKPLIGFSDITVVHAYLATRLGWASYYGPTLARLDGASNYTTSSFRHALMDPGPTLVASAPGCPPIATISDGVAEGPLAGGCLTLLAALVGTPWEVDLTGTILFFEDVDIQPYEVDTALTQLLASGALDGVRGFVVGDHTRCYAPELRESLSVAEVVADLLVPLGLPIITNVPIGHGAHQATLPLGVLAHLDAAAGVLEVGLT